MPALTLFDRIFAMQDYDRRVPPKNGHFLAWNSSTECWTPVFVGSGGGDGDGSLVIGAPVTGGIDSSILIVDADGNLDQMPRESRITCDSGPFDLAMGDWFFRTLNGSNGTITVVNERNNQFFTVELLQDPSGLRMVDWSLLGEIIWMMPNGVEPNIASGANLRTILQFKQISSGSFIGFFMGTQEAIRQLLIRQTRPS